MRRHAHMAVGAEVAPTARGTGGASQVPEEGRRREALQGRGHPETSLPTPCVKSQPEEARERAWEATDPPGCSFQERLKPANPGACQPVFFHCSQNTPVTQASGGRAACCRAGRFPWNGLPGKILGASRARPATGRFGHCLWLGVFGFSLSRYSEKGRLC